MEYFNYEYMHKFLSQQYYQYQNLKHYLVKEVNQNLINDKVKSQLNALDIIDILILYTIAFSFLYQIYRVLRHIYKHGLFKPLGKKIFGIAKKTCLKRRLQDESQKLTEKFYQDLSVNTSNKTFRIPTGGMKLSTIMERSKQWIERDRKKYDNGKQTGNRYIGSNEYESQVQEFSKQFIYHNPLHFNAYPACRQMEAEVILMTGDLFNAGKEVYGSVTSGGTESIICAILAYREYYKELKGIRKPNIVVPVTVHCAFDKACHYLGIEIIKIPVNKKNYEVNLRLVKKAINKDTICIVGSAPNFPHGIQDNIPKLSEIALQHGIGLHVDACLGGFIIPFYKKCGADLYDFDFTVKGVTSISIDHHKYGLAPKGVSVVLYRTAELRRAQYFSCSNWTGGIYATPTLSGSKSGCALSGAWFAMMYNGYNTYKDNAKLIFSSLEQLKQDLSQIDEIEVVGSPKINTLAFKSKNQKSFNIYKVHYGLSEKEWELGATQDPATIHFTLTLSNYKKIKQLVADIKACIQDIKENPQNYKGGSVAMYGSTSQIPDSDTIDDLTKLILDVIYKL